MKIQNICVKKLFGYLDYDIPLNQRDNITIIHGPNGCGKTTILTLLYAIFTWNYFKLRNIPFQEIQITFQNKKKLVVKRTRQSVKNASDKIREKVDINVLYAQQKYLLPDILAEPQFFSKISQIIPELQRIGPQEWLNNLIGEILSLEELLDIYADRISFDQLTEEFEQFKKLPKVLEVRFIQSQRLTRRKVAVQVILQRGWKKERNETVEFYSNEIRKIIKGKLAESVNIAQAKDRTFPSRLLQSPLSNTISQQELTDKFNQLEEKRRKLIAAGILNEQESLPFPKEQIDEMEKKVLWLYLQDAEEKLKVFDDLQQRIETFMTIIKSKLNSKEKSFEINQEEGFVLHSFFGENKNLTPNVLSSGEQHQLVVFYELLFRTPEHSLVLLDEPEISQHVEWQRRFLQDLARVVEIGKHSVLIATHSPQIIHDRWDLAVALQGGVQA